jgi:hypothetical protein
MAQGLSEWGKVHMVLHWLKEGKFRKGVDLRGLWQLQRPITERGGRAARGTNVNDS